MNRPTPSNRLFLPAIFAVKWRVCSRQRQLISRQGPIQACQRPSSNSGFTLVEVLVAMVLLAIGITGTMRAVGMSTIGSAQARDSILAATLAQEVMNQTLTSPTVATGTESGDFEEDHQGFRWESAVEASPEESGLLVVTVAVFWPNGLTERSLSVTTQIVDPSIVLETTTPADGSGGGIPGPGSAGG